MEMYELTPKYQRDGNSFIYSFKEMRIVGIFGNMEEGIGRVASEAQSLLGDNAHMVKQMGMQVAPNVNLNFFQAFHFQPPIDFTITSNPKDHSASMIALSLDEGLAKTQDLLGTIGARASFVSCEPPEDFVRAIPFKMMNKCSIFFETREKYRRDQLEHAFGHRFYKSFLKIRYIVNNDEDAEHMASKRYGNL